VIMWSWDASAPGRGGGGACRDEQAARRAAEAWMRANNRAETASVEQVRLSLGSGNLLTHYERTGTRLAARRHRNGRITWAPEQARPAQRAAS
jgi:hypothetical protein